MIDASNAMNTKDIFTIDTIKLGIEISDRYDARGFRNALNLRNEIYKLKDDLCKLLHIKFDLFWNEINTNAHTVFRLTPGAGIYGLIETQIKNQKSPYFITPSVDPQRTTDVANQWLTSNSWKLAECFIPQFLLAERKFTWRTSPSIFSFDNCDISQLLHIYKNCKKFTICSRKRARDVLRVRNELIAHLHKLDDLPNDIYATGWWEIEYFHQELLNINFE